MFGWVKSLAGTATVAEKGVQRKPKEEPVNEKTEDGPVPSPPISDTVRPFESKPAEKQDAVVLEITFPGKDMVHKYQGALEQLAAANTVVFAKARQVDLGCAALLKHCGDERDSWIVFKQQVDRLPSLCDSIQSLESKINGVFASIRAIETDIDRILDIHSSRSIQKAKKKAGIEKEAYRLLKQREVDECETALKLDYQTRKLKREQALQQALLEAQRQDAGTMARQKLMAEQLAVLQKEYETLKAEAVDQAAESDRLQQLKEQQRMLEASIQNLVDKWKPVEKTQERTKEGDVREKEGEEEESGEDGEEEEGSEEEEVVESNDEEEGNEGLVSAPSEEPEVVYSYPA